MMTKIVQLKRHGVYVGTANGADGTGWTFRPSRQHPELAPLESETFPSEAALLGAIDACWGPERVAAFQQARGERQAAYARRRAEEEAAARARSFTGDRFDATRPLTEVARLIARDLKAAVADGTLPPDRYAVTLRKASGWRRDRIVVWAWWAWRRYEAVEQIANRYNRCEGVPYDVPYDYLGDGGCPDRLHFQVEVERPRVPQSQSRPLYQAFKAGLLTYAEWGEEARALEHAAMLREGVEVEEPAAPAGRETAR